MAQVPRQTTSPINWQTPIVNPDGTMTEPMRRLLQSITGNGSSSGNAVQDLINAELMAGLGITITPDGHLLSNPEIAADIQALLDSISNVQGTVLYRDAAAWAALAPGTSGHFLKTNGPGANPEWAAGGGGGSSLIYAAATEASNGATTGSDVSVHTFALPAGTLTKVGDFLEIQAFYDWSASSSGTKAVKYQVGGTDVGGYSVTSSGGHQLFRYIVIAYLTDTTFRFYNNGISDVNTSFGSSANPSWLLAIQNDFSIGTGSFSAGFSLGPTVRSNVASTCRCTFTSIKKYTP